MNNLSHSSINGFQMFVKATPHHSYASTFEKYIALNDIGLYVLTHWILREVMNCVEKESYEKPITL